MPSKALKTRMSTKGQVILPKATRDSQHLKPGVEFIVEETPAGILLKPQPMFPPKTVDEVFGMLKWDGPPKTIEEMDAAILEEVQRRHARGRY